MNSVIEYFSGKSDEFAGNYSQQESFQERYRVWTSLIDKYANGRSTAIDMGCGSGIFSFYLAEKGMNVIGVDGASRMIEMCNRRKKELSLENINFYQAEIPFLETLKLDKADLIISSSVVEYIKPLDKTLKLFAALLTEQGKLILSLPNVDSYYRKFERYKFRLTGAPEYYRHVKNAFTGEGFNAKLEHSGFRQLEIRYYAHDNMISKLLRRLGFPEMHTENLFAGVYQKNP